MAISVIAQSIRLLRRGGPFRAHPHDLLGSIPRRRFARMAELVDAYDLKSYPTGCWFDSSYEQLTLELLRKSRVLIKGRYSRNRQLAQQGNFLFWFIHKYFNYLWYFLCYLRLKIYITEFLFISIFDVCKFCNFFYLRSLSIA